MAIFLLFPDFYVFWKGASSSTIGGVWLILVTPPLLGSYSHLQLITDWLLNCGWPSPAQWFWVPRPTIPMTWFYCLTTLRSFKCQLKFTSQINNNWLRFWRKRKFITPVFREHVWFMISLFVYLVIENRCRFMHSVSSAGISQEARN